MKVCEIADVPENDPCEQCIPCMRLRLMEMGLFEGQRIEVYEKKLGLWIVNILSDNNQIDSTVALRQEEFDRICLK